MNSKLFNSVVLAVCGVLFCLIMADVSGQWTGNVSMNGAKYPVTYDFKVDGNKLTGMSKSPLGSSIITDGKVDNDKISFNLDVKGELIPHTGKVYPDSVVLEIVYHGQDLHARLIRTPSN
jgi:hypothetical protein